MSGNHPLIECVPNFSEGRDPLVIEQITQAIRAVEGVSLLNVDPGKATNRTVVTFVGSPEAVVEAAFQAIRRASQLIDMRKHQGEHPRMGATDVCPLIPLQGISMEETALWAKRLGQRVGEELGIPVFLYEYAATDERWRNLANIRAGEYEGMAAKLAGEGFVPDFGPKALNPQAGVTAIGARDFLIAYNVNLNTSSVRRANSVAFDVREQGRILREGDPITGKPLLDENGEPQRQPGMCQAVKGIGWYIEEYGLAQVSMNLTNIRVTPLHKAFEACCISAQNRGMRVTGSELVGLVPLQVMLDAGRYFLAQQERSVGVSEEELIRIAVKTMGLDELAPFKPQERIIEYLIEDKTKTQPLIQLNLRAFANETASESPAPGGGSIAAYLGALGASLGTMVANLSSHKRGWDEQWAYFSDWAAKGQALKDQLLNLVDADTQAFNAIMTAFQLPKGSPEEKAARQAAIETATLGAIATPMRCLELALESFDLLEAMVERGNPNSVTDAAVGALCARSAALGAALNVEINAQGLKDQAKAAEFKAKAAELSAQAQARETAILALAKTKL